MPPPHIGLSLELTHAGRPYELTLLVSTVLGISITVIMVIVIIIIFIYYAVNGWFDFPASE